MLFVFCFSDLFWIFSCLFGLYILFLICCLFFILFPCFFGVLWGILFHNAIVHSSQGWWNLPSTAWGCHGIPRWWYMRAIYHQLHAIYPPGLVNIQKAIEHGHRNSEFSH
jgi:hypothetical protein